MIGQRLELSDVSAYDATDTSADAIEEALLEPLEAIGDEQHGLVGIDHTGTVDDYG